MCKFCEKTCEHKGYGQEEKEKNQICNKTPMFNKLQYQIADRHADAHLYFHSELGTRENAILDLIKTNSPFLREFGCGCCEFNGWCIPQEEEMHHINHVLHKE